MPSTPQRFFSFSDISDSIEALERIHGKERPLIYWVFLLTVFCAIASIFIIRIDVSVVGVGHIRPKSERIQILSPVSGVIGTINVYDNRNVKEGQKLISFQSRTLQSKIDFTRHALAETREHLADLDRLNRWISSIRIQNKGSEIPSAPHLSSPRFIQSYCEFAKDIHNALLSISKSEREFLRIEEIREDGFISDQEYENLYQQVRTRKHQMEMLVLGKASEWVIEYETSEMKAARLSGELEQLTEQANRYQIIAPSDGVAIGFRGIEENQFVAQGTHLGEISPKADLQAEIYLQSEDVGFIVPGQKVKIMVDAFPHTEWGTLSGRVKEVSRDFINMGDRIAFRALVELGDLTLQTKRGACVIARRGMGVSCRFIVNKRSLFHILFSKFSDSIHSQKS